MIEYFIIEDPIKSYFIANIALSSQYILLLFEWHGQVLKNDRSF